jgi:hypothetical protein
MSSTPAGVSWCVRAVKQPLTQTFRVVRVSRANALRVPVARAALRCSKLAWGSETKKETKGKERKGKKSDWPRLQSIWCTFLAQRKRPLELTLGGDMPQATGHLLRTAEHWVQSHCRLHGICDINVTNLQKIIILFLLLFLQCTLQIPSSITNIIHPQQLTALHNTGYETESPSYGVRSRRNLYGICWRKVTAGGTVFCSTLQLYPVHSVTCHPQGS